MLRGPANWCTSVSTLFKTSSIQLQKSRLSAWQIPTILFNLKTYHSRLRLAIPSVRRSAVWRQAANATMIAAESGENWNCCRDLQELRWRFQRIRSVHVT
jgi:hypothetical protein